MKNHLKENKKYIQLRHSGSKMPKIPDLTTVVIHEVTQEIVQLMRKISNLDPSLTFSFDDGLYSQWFFFNEFKNLPNPKIFYISTDFVPLGGVIQEHNITCSLAHKEVKKGPEGKKYYMTWKQINQVQMDLKCSIGMHGAGHINPDETSRNSNKIYKEDSKRMFLTFDANLKPKLGLKSTNYYQNFAYPYNITQDLYYAYLSSWCKKNNQLPPKVFKNRIAIEDYKFY